MGPELSLLISQAPLELREPHSQVVERLPEGATANLDLAFLAGVTAKRRGQQKTRRHATSATRTERMSGRWLAISDQDSPSSRLAYTSPSLVPK